MPLTGDEYQVVGVSVAGDGPVKSMVHLELDASVQALYGLNGAGKSRLLELVSSALSGVALSSREGEESTVADLHIKISNTERTSTGAFTLGLQRLLAQGVKQKQGALAQTSFSDALLDSNIQELIERQSTNDIWTHLAALIDLADVHDGLLGGLASELYDATYAGCLTLRAMGTAQKPSWDVYLSLPMAADSVRQRFDMASAAWSELHAIAEMAEGEERDDRLNEWHADIGKLSALPLSPASAYWGRGKARRSTKPVSWPSWLQVPALLVAEKVAGTPVRVMGTKGGHDVDGDTLDRLLELVSYAPGPTRPNLVTGVEEGTPKFNALLITALGRIERDANKYTSAVLLDPPSLRFILGTPDLWLSTKLPHWEYLERWTTEWLPIDQLSSARERWVRLAIELATAPVDETPAVFICDEPERGLHRLAEGRISQGLPVLARTRPFGVLAATHSPALLNSNEIQPLLVSRTDESGAQVRPASISLVDRVATEATAQDLGMSVGDLWPLSRVTVVVEGLHDEAVFTALLRSTLDAAPAGVYAIHGGTKLKSLAEPALMINATDAEILVVLDELQSSVVDPLWSEVKRLTAIGDFDEAREAIDVLRQQDGDSFRFLHQFAFRALESGCLDRVHVHGLSLPDVICYLPENELLLTPEHWDSLIHDWRSGAAPKVASNIKKWLKSRGALPTDEKDLDRLVVEAAQRTARAGLPIHQDLVRLGMRIRELASLK